MPLVRIDVMEGKPKEFLEKVSAAVHRALVEAIAVPPDDRFQIVTEHRKEQFIYDQQYLKIPRSDGLIIIQATISAGRSIELKKALFQRITTLLNQELGVRKEDVFINLVEVAKENWSFGNGEAQYAI